MLQCLTNTNCRFTATQNAFVKVIGHILNKMYHKLTYIYYHMLDAELRTHNIFINTDWRFYSACDKRGMFGFIAVETRLINTLDTRKHLIHTSTCFFKLNLKKYTKHNNT